MKRRRSLHYKIASVSENSDIHFLALLAFNIDRLILKNTERFYL